MKSQSNVFFSAPITLLMLACPSLVFAAARPGDMLTTQYTVEVDARSIHPDDQSTYAPEVQGHKIDLIRSAEKQCGSAVKQITPFVVPVPEYAGPANYRIKVSAKFECIGGSESDTLMSDVNQYLIPEIAAVKTDPHFHPGVVRHFVTFRFTPGTPTANIEKVRTAFLQLQTLCVRNGRPYAKIEAGNANSLESADQGMQVGFLVTFQSEGDRNYYVGQPMINPRQTNFYDHAHLAFKNLVGPHLQKGGGAFVFDFTRNE